MFWKKNKTNPRLQEATELRNQFSLDPNDEKVTGPRDHFTRHKILYDFGPASYAVASGHWHDADANNPIGYEGAVLAIRWNGATGKSVGRPASKDYTGQWFPLPEELWEGVLKASSIRAGREELRKVPKPGHKKE